RRAEVGGVDGGRLAGWEALDVAAEEGDAGPADLLARLRGDALLAAEACHRSGTRDHDEDAPGDRAGVRRGGEGDLEAGAARTALSSEWPRDHREESEREGCAITPPGPCEPVHNSSAIDEQALGETRQ